MPAKTILVTGASSGFGALTVRALGAAGHTVYAGMRDIDGRNARAAQQLAADANGADLRAIELDVTSDASVDSAAAEIGRLDVVVHNAGHMVFGAAEAFTADELGRTSSRGGCPPFLGPYFAAKAAGDALAVSYAGELIRFGIDTTIVVPGAFTSGTNHFANAATPSDTERDAAYDELYGTLRGELPERLGALIPADADAARVAAEILRVVDMPRQQRPFRTTIDPSHDGSEVVSAVADRIRTEFFRRIGIDDLLPPIPSL